MQNRLPAGYISPREFARTLGLEPDGAVLLGLSGGADSVSLLNMLLQDGVRVCAAHLNHCIRGKDADRDEEFCRALCGRLGVEFVSRRADVPAISQECGEGLEEAARRVRYSFFAEIMKEKGIKLLATAHNGDDNAETLLFNIARGASAAGACGIPRFREFCGGYVIRPIIGLPKDTVLAYCAENGLEYVTDATNADVSYSRNRIRANVIPELKTINPNLVATVSGFTEAMRADCEYLDSLAAGFIAANAGVTQKKLAALPAPVASRVLVELAKRNGARPERVHIKALLEGAASGQATAVTMPGGIIARLSRRRPLSFEKDERKKKTKHTEI